MFQFKLRQQRKMNVYKLPRILIDMKMEFAITGANLQSANYYHRYYEYLANKCINNWYYFMTIIEKCGNWS